MLFACFVFFVLFLFVCLFVLFCLCRTTWNRSSRTDVAREVSQGFHSPFVAFCAQESGFRFSRSFEHLDVTLNCRPSGGRCITHTANVPCFADADCKWTSATTRAGGACIDWCVPVGFTLPAHIHHAQTLSHMHHAQTVACYQLLDFTLPAHHTQTLPRAVSCQLLLVFVAAALPGIYCHHSCAVA